MIRLCSEHFKQFNSYVQGFRALGLYDSSVGDLSLKIASRVTVDGGDVLECRSDQVGELADKLVVRHASAVSTELPIQLDPAAYAAHMVFVELLIALMAAIVAELESAQTVVGASIMRS